MSMPSLNRRGLTAAFAIAMTWVAGTAASRQPPPVDDSPAAYLAGWDLDRERWAALAEPGPWDDARQSLVLKLMARLWRVPADRAARWQAAAADVSSALPTTAADDLVRIEGRAVFVAPQRLTADQAAVAGREAIDLVRITTAAGAAVDVIVESAPAAWPRWTAIDESAAVVGMPLTAGPGPVPQAEGQAWPAESPALVVLAMRISWYPATPLGMLGMDYATFATVADGKPLVAGDTAAFYGMLAAAGRAAAGAIEEAAGPPVDVIPLIDPAARWFASHRGDPVTVEGVVRRATRIVIDDPEQRRLVGADHYWELYVFVPTPPIRIGETVQDDFPIVCCVLTLPDGMPTGERIGERVRVSGFALKRYAYPLPRVRISSSQGDKERGGGRRETPLLIGSEARWLPGPSPRRWSNDLGWILLGITGIIGLLLAGAMWSARRAARRAERRAREQLPDRIDLPPVG